MLGYLKKFTIDILPSIVATIVGAFIVHHYVIPAATPKDPAPAVASVPAKLDEPSDKDSFAKGVAEKSAIEKTAEKAAEKSNDSAPADSRRRHTAARAPVRQDATEPTIGDERRDANNLARAAIERLRSNDSSRTVSVAPVQSAAPMTSPPQTQASLPPLPTATPQPEVFTAGTGPLIAPGRAQPSQAPLRSAEFVKPMPPEAIPTAPPLELHDDIVTTATSRATTVADDVMSAAKSIIHTVLPR